MSRLPNDAARRRQLAERRAAQGKLVGRPRQAIFAASRVELDGYRKAHPSIRVEYMPHQGARETSRRLSRA